MSVLKFADLEDENFELKKEVAALRRALKSHGEIVEENHKLRQDLKTALQRQDELNLLVGHQGSNEQDRKFDKYYEETQEVANKYKLR